MSTKVMESCPKCKADTHPTDASVHVKTKQVYVSFWRYNCPGCNWVWANEAQRKHNQKVWDKAHAFLSGRGWA